MSDESKSPPNDWSGWTPSLRKTFLEMAAAGRPDFSTLIGSLNAGSGSLGTLLSGNIFRSLSDARDFQRVIDTPTIYSEEFISPATYFERDEVEVNSFSELNQQISALITKVGTLPLVWRGAQNATWGLYSSLYRHLMSVNMVKLPQEKPRSAQNFPTEDQMVRAEARILEIARDEWRMDGSPALEVFAQLQHYGAPTRLLDVTRNPYIAAWFAVEASEEHNESDARLFALATRPMQQANDVEIESGTQIRLDEVGGGYLPFWHLLRSSADRQELDWGTGARRRFWVPPAYDARIVAQNAGFILDGIPMVTQQTASSFRRPTDEQKFWSKNDLLASASIYAKTYHPNRKPRATKRRFSPTFTFRITAKAKFEIRNVLEERFSYRRSTIYPDVAALAGYLKSSTEIYR